MRLRWVSTHGTPSSHATGSVRRLCGLRSMNWMMCGRNFKSDQTNHGPGIVIRCVGKTSTPGPRVTVAPASSGPYAMPGWPLEQ